MADSSVLGPVELLVLTFPGTRVAAAVSEALATVVARGDVTLLDLVVLSADEAGSVSEFEIDDEVAEIGLTGLTASELDLVSDSDLDVVREGLEPGTTAVVLVFENTWARNLAATVRAAEGRVDLHVQVPRDALDAAIAAAS
ncbi:DUF6325 family protein [Nocardia thailandica]